MSKKPKPQTLETLGEDVYGNRAAEAEKNAAHESRERTERMDAARAAGVPVDPERSTSSPADSEPAQPVAEIPTTEPETENRTTETEPPTDANPPETSTASSEPATGIAESTPVTTGASDVVSDPNPKPSLNSGPANGQESRNENLEEVWEAMRRVDACENAANEAQGALTDAKERLKAREKDFSDAVQHLRDCLRDQKAGQLRLPFATAPSSAGADDLIPSDLVPCGTPVAKAEPGGTMGNSAEEPQNPSEEKGSDGDSVPRGTLRVVPADVDDESWRDVELGLMPGMPARAAKAFSDADMITLGQFTDWVKKWDGNNLLAIKGIGEALASQVEEVFARFYAERKRQREAALVPSEPVAGAM